MKIANWFGRTASVSQMLTELQRWSGEKCLEVEWACWPGRKGDLQISHFAICNLQFAICYSLLHFAIPRQISGLIVSA